MKAITCNVGKPANAKQQGSVLKNADDLSAIQMTTPEALSRDSGFIGSGND
jgi:hypothetical protein